MRRTTTEELERLLDGPEKEYDLAVAKARPAADLRWLFGMLLLLASTLVTVTYLTQYLGGLRITSTQIPNESCDLGIDDVGAFVWPAQVAACDGIVGGDAIEHLSANRQRWACPTGAANSVTAESLAADSLAADSLAADSLAADVLSDPDSDPDSSSSKKPLVQRSGVSVSNRWYGVSVLRSMLFLAIPYSMGKVAAANRRTLRLALVGLTLLLSWFLGWITFKNTRDSYDHYTCMTKLHVTDASNLTFEPLTSKLPFVLTAVDTLNLGLQLV
ncbi:putative transmembrane protein [Gregarina niphandrodes]|uniref:Transmembrane protein n=1 Tax=Gregarina niphandrodes TaxID=110365 RepID=A0A023B0C9_GRENI|nr:putative transmembrane protein [Gregarina niphandrodes]EZG45316.1 putative transmembrane protein [Gregarina niphandrodes]|eukprot:XP_011132531.1 putative transmembrane protein [Gregarina niphandrodes]